VSPHSTLIGVGLLAFSAASAFAAADPYEALKAMDGHWIATTVGGRTQTIDNHCARTGLFFVCEQAVGGKPAALVVFLPKSRGEIKLEFRTQTLTAAGDRAGPWRDLIIDGDHWTYADLEKRLGVKRRERTVITHSGPDFMRAEIQATKDGETWTMVSSETFNRAP
jgi:hypothetical protein